MHNRFYGSRTDKTPLLKLSRALFSVVDSVVAIACVTPGEPREMLNAQFYHLEPYYLVSRIRACGIARQY